MKKGMFKIVWNVVFKVQHLLIFYFSQEVRMKTKWGNQLKLSMLMGFNRIDSAKVETTSSTIQTNKSSTRTTKHRYWDNSKSTQDKRSLFEQSINIHFRQFQLQTTIFSKYTNCLPCILNEKMNLFLGKHEHTERNEHI